MTPYLATLAADLADAADFTEYLHAIDRARDGIADATRAKRQDEVDEAHALMAAARDRLGIVG